MAETVEMKVYFRAETAQGVTMETDRMMHGSSERNCWIKGAEWGARWAWDQAETDARKVTSITMWRSGD